VLETLTPDLEISLRLDTFAPRAARHRVEEVGHLGPDLRDAVTLLTSDLVSQAVCRCDTDRGPSVQLRAWAPKHMVRVELWAPSVLLQPSSDSGLSLYERRLLDQVADRWSIEDTDSTACMWFEIDRGERESPTVIAEDLGRSGRHKEDAAPGRLRNPS
jgi:hypothetical protein